MLKKKDECTEVCVWSTQWTRVIAVFLVGSKTLILKINPELWWRTSCAVWRDRCVCSVLQSCCRGDGDCGLEVHGGLSSSPGGRGVPIPGVRPVPLPGASTQASQAILTALRHRHQSPLAHTPIKTHIPNWTCAIQNPPSLKRNDRDDFSPFCCYLLLLPKTWPSPPPCPSQTCCTRWPTFEEEREAKQWGRMPNQVDVCRLQRKPTTSPPSSF